MKEKTGQEILEEAYISYLIYCKDSKGFPWKIYFKEDSWNKTSLEKGHKHRFFSNGSLLKEKICSLISKKENQYRR